MASRLSGGRAAIISSGLVALLVTMMELPPLAQADVPMIPPMSFSPARGLSRWRQASSLAGASAFDLHRGPGKELRRWPRPTSRRRHRCPRIRHSRRSNSARVVGSIAADIPGLCERAQALLTRRRRGPARVRRRGDRRAGRRRRSMPWLDSSSRRGGWVARCGSSMPPPELHGLLAFMGLSGVVPLSERSGVEARRQTEEREQRSRVEEERDPADPAI